MASLGAPEEMLDETCDREAVLRFLGVRQARRKGTTMEDLSLEAARVASLAVPQR